MYICAPFALIVPLLTIGEFPIMKRERGFELKTTTDIKVFLLFILDNIGYPVEHGTVMDIVEENLDDISLDYDEALRQLVVSGHILYDEVDGIRYYMISDKGRMVASELYDSLDKSFRERALRCTIKHISFAEGGVRIRCYITEAEKGRFRVTMEAADKYGEILNTSLTVNSRAEAEAIKRNYEAKPDAVYKGIFFSVTGKLEYIS